MDHILIYGPPGLGKTTIAKIVSNYMGSKLKVTSGPVIERVGDVAAILMSLQDNDVLFIDEIHRLNRAVEEMLYPAMEDRRMDIIIGKGPTAKSVRIALKKFTLIGATTKSSMLTAPLRDRFGFLHKIEYYPINELLEIVLRNAVALGFEIEESAALRLAEISRGTPRIANRFLKRIRDLATMNEIGKISSKLVDELLKMMDIDELGLDVTDREILKAIAKHGPIGIESLASILGEDRKSIESFHEPYLVKKELIERSKKGRIITKRGYEHISKK